MRNYDMAPPTVEDIKRLEKTIEQMEARRCSTCKHWELSSLCALTDPERGVEVRRDAMLPGADECGEFFQPVITGPDFGCVRWEAKA